MTKSDEYHFTISDRRFTFDDEGVPSFTSLEQKHTENLISETNDSNKSQLPDKLMASEASLLLNREHHIQFVLNNLRSLSRHYMSMDASRTWFCFWGMHSLRMLGYRPDKDFLHKLVVFLKSCEAPCGGYGGGPGQLPHLATTYAAVMALVSIGTDEALASIDRKKVCAFIVSMKRANGGFSLHSGGESDIRGVYCAISTAILTNVADDNLFLDTATWIMRCQTYEGGFGGEPNCEAHGGYMFCAVAALALLHKTHLINPNDALNWLVMRQMPFEGGFNGRTNKLVDGCYSYWQAATFFTLEYQISAEIKRPIRGLFDEEALQRYVLAICQDRKNGGLRDKPEKPSDLYHTCYALSGLAIAQSYTNSSDSFNLIGGDVNRLEDVHPLFNVCVSYEARAKEYFLKCSE